MESGRMSISPALAANPAIFFPAPFLKLVANDPAGRKRPHWEQYASLCQCILIQSRLNLSYIM